MNELSTLSIGQLHARTLDALRKLHEVLTCPLDGMSVERLTEYRLAEAVRVKTAGEVLDEWKRRMPAVKKMSDVPPTKSMVTVPCRACRVPVQTFSQERAKSGFVVCRDCHKEAEA